VQINLCSPVSAETVKTGFGRPLRLPVGPIQWRGWMLGWYGVPSGMMVTLPVRFECPGEWQVVRDIDLTTSEASQLSHIIEVMHHLLCR